MPTREMHKSDSRVQREAESWVRDAYSKAKLTGPHVLELRGGAKVSVDALSAGGTTAFEIFVHQGKLKSGQRRKVATDVLKLVAVAESVPKVKRTVLLLADADIANGLRFGKSWLTEAIKGSGVRIESVELSEEQIRLIRATQSEQGR